MGVDSPAPPAQTAPAQATETMLQMHQGLVHAIVRRFAGRGADMDDLVQVGMLGLYKAILGFDPHYGVAFSTYAVPKIEGEIRRYLRDDGMIRISRSIYERAGRVRRCERELAASLGRAPRLSELSAALSLPPEEVSEALMAFSEVDSLEREVGDDRVPLGALLADTAAEQATADALELRDAVAQLPEKERDVIHCLFYHGLTQVQTAALLGISQVQVSRLRRRALDKLYEALAD